VGDRGAAALATALRATKAPFRSLQLSENVNVAGAGAKAGGLLRTSTRPTLNQREIKIGPLAMAWGNAHTMTSWSVGHHKPSLRVCVSRHPEVFGKSWSNLGSSACSQ